MNMRFPPFLTVHRGSLKKSHFEEEFLIRNNLLPHDHTSDTALAVVKLWQERIVLGTDSRRGDDLIVGFGLVRGQCSGAEP